MKFVGVIERPITITVDGYSNAKTVNGAIAEFGRYIAKHFDEGEGKSLIEYKSECVLEPDEYGGYFLTIEKVPCACKLNEETEEMEYSDGNYYLCMRFVK